MIKILLVGIYINSLKYIYILFLTIYDGYVLGLPKPKDEPKINGGSGIYPTGDTINLNCTSGKSFPAAKLRWFINNEIVSQTCFN